MSFATREVSFWCLWGGTSGRRMRCPIRCLLGRRTSSTVRKVGWGNNTRRKCRCQTSPPLTFARRKCEEIATTHVHAQRLTTLSAKSPCPVQVGSYVSWTGAEIRLRSPETLSVRAGNLETDHGTCFSRWLIAEEMWG